MSETGVREELKDKSVAKALARVGFKPPVYAFVKDDPRGPNYGRFTAHQAGGVSGDDPSFVVTWEACGNPEHRYTMTMDFESFMVWAKECT